MKTTREQVLIAELAEALKQAFAHVPEDNRTDSRCVEVSGSGNTYEISDSPWYVAAKAVLAELEGPARGV